MNFDKDTFDKRSKETHKYLRKLESSDEMIFVITSHLLTEYVLNAIIENKCKIPKKRPKEIDRYSYSRKLEIAYCMGLIPDYLYENLCQINDLRNKFAHNLHPTPKVFFYNTITWRFPEMVVVKCDAKSKLYKGIANPYKKFLNDMCESTFFLFFEHTFCTLNIDVSFERLQRERTS